MTQKGNDGRAAEFSYGAGAGEVPRQARLRGLKRFAARLALSVGITLVASGLVAGASGAQSGTQRYSKVIEIAASGGSARAADPALPAAPAGTWVQLALDREVLGNAAVDLADLRVVDASGGLVPFRLKGQDPMDTQWSRLRSAPLVWKPNPGRGWFAELQVDDLPDRAILLVGEPNVRIEADDEERRIYAEQRPVDPSRSAFILPGGDSRWKLYTNRTSSEPAAGAEFYEERRSPRVLEEVPFTLHEERPLEGGWTGRIELEGPGRVVTTIEARPASGVPHHVEVSVEVPGQGWVMMSTGILAPRAGEGGLESGEAATGDGEAIGGGEAPSGVPMRIDWTHGPRTDRVRVRLPGSPGTGAPIEILRVLAVPDEVEFRTTGSPPFRLLYGDPYLHAADFTLTEPGFLVPFRLPATLGPEEPNPFAAPPRGMEWLRRHPTVLSIALLAILALVAVLALGGRSRPGDAGVAS